MRRFRSLQVLLEQEGRFVLFEDLVGAGGALFRLYWSAETAGRSSGVSNAASICSGDPLARAANAYQFTIVPSAEGSGESFSIMRTGETATLEKRIVFFIDSLEEASRLYREGEHFDGERYLSGRAAYEGMMRAVDREGAAADPAGRCAAELVSLLPAIGESRRMLGRYLDRLGNFIGTGPAIDPFEREGSDLVAAGQIVEEKGGLLPGAVGEVTRLLRDARKQYNRGFRVIHSVLEEERRS